MIEGKVWLFGDNIDTDSLAPGAYMKLSIKELAKHCLESINPNFANQVETGDIIIAGEAFGIGSSREQAAQTLIELGVKAIVAKSFARIFYRNALNLGLIVLEYPQIEANASDNFKINPVIGEITNTTQGKTWHCSPIPERLMAIVNAGGLMPFLKNKLNVNRRQIN